MNKEIKTLEDLENFCKKNTGHGINVPPFVYIDQYFADIEKTYGNGYKAGYKDAMSVIDAIKAEIKSKKFSGYANDNGSADLPDHQAHFNSGLILALEIIDKHTRGAE